MKRLPKFLVIVILAAALVFLYVSYYHSGDPAQLKPQFTDAELEVRPVKVRAQKAFVGELVQSVTVSGVTEAAQEVEVKSMVSGWIKNIFVKDGDRVKQGQILVQLDDREYQFALDEAKSNLLDAQLEYALMKSEKSPSQPADPAIAEESGHNPHPSELEEKYEQARREYEEGRMTMREFLEIEREYHIESILRGNLQEDMMRQRSGLAAAETQYLRADYNLQNCQIRAPFGGIVGEVQVHKGALVSSSQTLLRLVNLERLRLKLQVLESEIGSIQKGETIQATFAAFPDTVFEGTITGINPRVDPQSRTCTVVAEIPTPAQLLKAGMFAKTRIVVNRYPDRLLVPREAVLERDQKRLVFIVREGNAFWCYVETGLQNEEYIEILSSTFDLKAGEMVIVDGHFALAHNAPVEVINPLP